MNGRSFIMAKSCAGAIPFDIQIIFGEPPLLPDEDLEAYEFLANRVHKAINPKSIFEHVLTRDYINLVWDVGRLRLVRNEILQNAQMAGIKSVLCTVRPA